MLAQHGCVQKSSIPTIFLCVRTLCLAQGISSNTLALCEVTAPSPSVHISLHGGYHLSSSEAEVELFLRLNHARQTVDFVHQQV